MKRNMWNKIVAIGMAFGMLTASTSMASFADEMIVEEDYAIVAEDDTEAMQVSETNETEDGANLIDQIFFSEDESTNALGIIIDETETTLYAAEEGDIPIDEVHFPDPNFRVVISRKPYDSNEDGVLSANEIADITELVIPDYHISSLKGIEYFSNLTILDCHENPLMNLDISKNTVLEYLNCYTNQLTSLDISKNTALEYLDCYDNQITSLDMSNNTVLQKLNCAENQLTNLDTSKNTNLEYLSCYNNQLTNLDVSNNTDLKELECHYNQLMRLDVSDNTRLNELDCSINQLTSLELGNNTALEYLICEQNGLTSLDVSNNTALKELDCICNQLTSLDVSKNIKLKDLRCDVNQLTSLIVSNNKDLEVLKCSCNQLSSLDVSKNTALWQLECYDNRLKDLDISNCSYLVNAYQSGEHFSDEDYEIYHYYTGVDEEDDARTYTLLCDPSITIIVDNSGGDTPVVIPTPAPVPQPAQPTVPSTVQESITISKKPTIKKPSSTKNKITVSWKHFKQTKKTKSIWKKIKKVQVQCATDKGFANIVKSTMVGKKKTKAAIKGLAKKTTYYVRVRYYDGTGYSAWSKVKKVKTK